MTFSTTPASSRLLQPPPVTFSHKFPGLRSLKMSKSRETHTSEREELQNEADLLKKTISKIMLAYVRTHKLELKYIEQNI